MSTSSDGTTDRVREVFAEILELRADEVPDDAAFYDDLGGDSLQKLDLAVALETEFAVTFTDEDVARISTVADAVERLRRVGVA